MSTETDTALSDAAAYRTWRLQQWCPRCAGGVESCLECHGVSRKPSPEDDRAELADERSYEGDL